jgi:hypothetical protein
VKRVLGPGPGVSAIRQGRGKHRTRVHCRGAACNILYEWYGLSVVAKAFRVTFA